MWLKHTYFTAWAEFYWEVYNKAVYTIMPSESWELCIRIDYAVSNIIEINHVERLPITKEVNHNVG